MRRFIPLMTIEDVVINEGLKKWDVRHYLATIKQIGPKSSVMEVAYEVSYLLEGKLLLTDNGVTWI
jgi:GPI-GlcNAc transferase complex, PIG-H component